jgi:hypothetical protein
VLDALARWARRVVRWLAELLAGTKPCVDCLPQPDTQAPARPAPPTVDEFEG